MSVVEEDEDAESVKPCYKLTSADTLQHVPPLRLLEKGHKIQFHAFFQSSLRILPLSTLWTTVF
eukprot:59337-Amphidinium_carterae.1